LLEQISRGVGPRQMSIVEHHDDASFLVCVGDDRPRRFFDVRGVERSGRQPDELALVVLGPLLEQA